MSNFKISALSCGDRKMVMIFHCFLANPGCPTLALSFAASLLWLRAALILPAMHVAFRDPVYIMTQ